MPIEAKKAAVAVGGRELARGVEEVGDQDPVVELERELESLAQRRSRRLA